MRILAAVLLVTLSISTVAPAAESDSASPQASGAAASAPVSPVEKYLADLGVFAAPQVGLLFAPAPHGDLLVVGVKPESPSARAGLQRGDFIVQINGQPVPSLEELKAVIREGVPHDTVTLTLWRGGKEFERNLLVQPKDGSQSDKPRPWAGIQCDEVPGTGFVIQSVYPGGPAAQAGLQEGDVVESVDGIAIHSHVDAEHYLRQAKPFTEANVVVLRDGQQHTFQVELGGLRQTPQGLQFDSEPGVEASGASAATLGPAALLLQQQRFEAEQRQRLEQLLQEIRQDVKELKQSATSSNEG